MRSDQRSDASRLEAKRISLGSLMKLGPTKVGYSELGKVIETAGMGQADSG